MSRSFKKTPIFGNCCGSDTTERRKSNRAYRHRVRLALHSMDDFDAEVLPVLGENPAEDSWSWTTDGRRYYHDLDARELVKYMTK